MVVHNYVEKDQIYPPGILRLESTGLVDST